MLVNALQCTFLDLLIILQYNYNVNGESLGRVSEFKDLGVHFDRKLNFGLRVEQIEVKALTTWGFVRRKYRLLKIWTPSKCCLVL